MQLEEAKGYEMLCRREHEKKPSVNRLITWLRSIDQLTLMQGRKLKLEVLREARMAEKGRFVGGDE
jgi:hypothetical protein